MFLWRYKKFQGRLLLKIGTLSRLQKCQDEPGNVCKPMNNCPDFSVKEG